MDKFKKTIKANMVLLLSILCFSLAYITAKSWIFFHFPSPEYRSDASTYFKIARVILEGHWPDFYMRGPGFPLFEVFSCKIFSPSLHAIVLGQLGFFYLSGLYLIYTMARWKQCYAIPVSFGLSLFSFLNISALQDTMLYSDSFYTGFVILTLAVTSQTLRKPNWQSCTLFSICVGYLLWIKVAALYMVVIAIIIALHGKIKQWKKTNIALLFLPFMGMLFALIVYNGINIGHYSLTPWGGVNKMGPGVGFWKTDPNYPQKINDSILKSRKTFRPEDMKTIKESWEPMRVWQAYQNNWGTCRYGCFDFSDLKDQPHFNAMGKEAIFNNMGIYLKFVYTMSYMNFFFYPTVDNQNFAVNHYHRKWTALEHASRPEVGDHKFYHPTHEPWTFEEMNQSPILGWFKPYQHYTLAYTFLKPYIRNLFWTSIWLISILTALISCLRHRFKNDLEVLCLCLALIPLGAGILTCMFEVAILRYSYPFEAIMFISPLLLWITLPLHRAKQVISNSTDTLWKIITSKTQNMIIATLSFLVISAFMLYTLVDHSKSTYTKEPISLQQIAKITTTQQPQGLTQLSSQLRNMSAPKYALDAANMALDIMTNDVHSLFEKGLALETLQRSKEANKTFDFILSLQPKSEKDVFFIGQVLFKRQKVQEAIHFYKQVRRKLPSFHPGKFQNLSPEQKAEWDRIFSQP